MKALWGSHCHVDSLIVEVGTRSFVDCRCIHLNTSCHGGDTEGDQTGEVSLHLQTHRERVCVGMFKPCVQATYQETEKSGIHTGRKHAVGGTFSNHFAMKYTRSINIGWCIQDLCVRVAYERRQLNVAPKNARTINGGWCIHRLCERTVHENLETVRW